MALYRSTVLKNYYIETDEDYSEYLSQFSDDWRSTATEQYNFSAKEFNLDPLDDFETEKLNSYDFLIYITDRIPIAVSYKFEEFDEREKAESEKEMDLVEIKTIDDFELFMDNINQCWN